MNKIFNFIVPMYANHKMNTKLYEKINLQNEEGECIELGSTLLDIENTQKVKLDLLKGVYEDTFKTKDKLEDKAKLNVICVTITTTLIMGASGIISALNTKFPYIFLSWLLFSLFIISVTYMIFAGLLVIKLLISENEIYTVNFENLVNGKKKLSDDYNKCIVMNQYKNIIRNNYLFTSYECIRNALICLFVILIFAVIPYDSSQGSENLKKVYSYEKYNFLFLSAAVENLKSKDDYNMVRQIVLKELSKNNKKKYCYNVSIFDENNRLFIKFNVNAEEVTIYLIEKVDK